MPSRWRPKQPRNWWNDFARGGAIGWVVLGPMMVMFGLLRHEGVPVVIGLSGFLVGAVILILDSEVSDAE